jgi:hypothetical protein
MTSSILPVTCGFRFLVTQNASVFPRALPSFLPRRRRSEVSYAIRYIEPDFDGVYRMLILLPAHQSVIALTKDHQYHAQTKHIDVRFHFIRWIVEQGAVCLVYCPTDDMVADTLTKALPSTKVKHFAVELRLTVG